MEHFVQSKHGAVIGGELRDGVYDRGVGIVGPVC